jgi:hypothetical protein
MADLILEIGENDPVIVEVLGGVQVVLPIVPAQNGTLGIVQGEASKEVGISVQITDGIIDGIKINNVNLENALAGAVTSVNEKVGAVVLDAADIESEHTAVNYTPTSTDVDGHIAGIDTKIGEIGGAIPTDISQLTDTTNLIPKLDDYLSKTNTTAYTPTADYHPATKKYGDDLHAKFLNDRAITKEPTGFISPENITVTYYGNDEVVESERRTVVLTGTIEAYYKGEHITALVNGWRSPQHTNTTGTFFLHYCDGAFVFDTSPWTFDCLQIAFVQVNSHTIGIRETHGFMQWQSHKELHETIGTYKISGGTLTTGSYTLGSAVATNRRPLVDQTVVADEDLKSTITPLVTQSYTQRVMTGTGTRVMTPEQTEILPVNGNIPYYNQWNGTEWLQTPMTNGDYAAMYLMAIPTTADTGSLRFRYAWVQAQAVGSLLAAQNHIPAQLNIGDPAVLLSEYVFIQKLIIFVTGNNWQIHSTQTLTGTKFSQVGSPAGNYLSTVSTDSTLSGSGTSADPLSVANANVIYSNLEVLTTDFVADTTYGDYGYRAPILLTGVVATDTPQVIFAPTEADSGTFASVSTSYAGGVYIYASEVPSATIIIPTIIVVKGV